MYITSKLQVFAAKIIEEIADTPGSFKNQLHVLPTSIEIKFLDAKLVFV